MVVIKEETRGRKQKIPRDILFNILDSIGPDFSEAARILQKEHEIKATRAAISFIVNTEPGFAEFKRPKNLPKRQIRFLNPATQATAAQNRELPREELALAEILPYYFRSENPKKAAKQLKISESRVRGVLGYAEGGTSAFAENLRDYLTDEILGKIAGAYRLPKKKIRELIKVIDKQGRLKTRMGHKIKLSDPLFKKLAANSAIRRHQLAVLQAGLLFMKTGSVIKMAKQLRISPTAAYERRIFYLGGIKHLKALRQRRAI